MAGHSKWAQIKRTKAKVDAARGAVFTRMSREIIVAARLGGGDPAGNFRLRAAMEAARKAGVPGENIKRAVAKGIGVDGAEVLEELRYEGYGPGGAAFLVRACTDNRNRTAADLRTVFGRLGGNLGETGCVGYMFAERGVVLLSSEEDLLPSEEEVLEVALEAGADDIRLSTGAFLVFCPVAGLESVSDALRAAGFPVASVEVQDVPDVQVTVEDPDLGRKLLLLVERLEELDDVQRVAANFDLPDDLLARLTAEDQD
ncbi:MAG: YebC/PmpR family DNA-binding transcriptional regulator [Candidatus Sericytochromatia bacterium]|nr:YebC/PmpR family DNA-binding transcriptional regulator [Candidatus Sericytochromatia bacterium]